MSVTTEQRKHPARVRRNPAQVREDILAVATSEFARTGLSGARVNEIAEKTKTTKRMLYYYFGDKEGLYTAVLERSYKLLRDTERLAAAEGVDPVRDLRRMTEATFDFHNEHRDHVRLVAGENLLRGEYLRSSPELTELGRPGLVVLEQIVDQGKTSGVFRPDLDAFDLHVLINSFTLFRVSNQHTIATLFGRDMLDSDEEQRMRQYLTETVLRSALRNPA